MGDTYNFLKDAYTKLLNKVNDYEEVLKWYAGMYEWGEYVKESPRRGKKAADVLAKYSQDVKRED